MRAAAVPVLLCAAALSAQSWPTFYSAYQDGLDAQQRGDHTLAASAFKRAIALEPRPAQRIKTYGLNFLPRYFPYLRLAESALAVGDLAGAEAALAQSGRLGLEPAQERNPLLERLRKLQQARLPAAAQPAPAVPAPPVPPSAVPVQPAPAPPSLPVQPAVPPPQSPAAKAEPRRQPQPAPTPAPAQAAPPAAPVPVPAMQAAVAPEPVPAPVRPRSWSLALALAALASAAAGFLLLRRRRPARRPAAAETLGVPSAPAGIDPAVTAGLSFGPFTARHVLGRGGCATAYYGRHRETGLEVAIKVPHPHLAEDPEFRARFRREASLGALLDHPRVVKILDPGPAEGDLWLAMEFIRGTTLEAFLDGRAPIPVDQAVAIATDIAEAIAYAHGKGVVHRDLKPANIMLNEDGAVVMDFGIARMLDAAMTSSTMFLGTPLYCAPECILGTKAGPPADRYALGMMLFEMLTGHPPFHGDTVYRILEAQRFEPLPDLAGLRPFTPPRLVRLVERLCAKPPEERPEDPETLAILHELRTSAPPRAEVPPG